MTDNNGHTTALIVLALDYTGKGLLERPVIVAYDFINNNVITLNGLNSVYRDLIYVGKNKEAVEAWEVSGIASLEETSLHKIDREPHAKILVKYVESKGTLRSLYFNTRTKQLELSDGTPKEQLIYATQRENLLIRRQRSVLLRLNSFREVIQKQLIDKFKTDISDKWLSRAKGGAVLVHNTDVNINYVFTDVNGIPCYTSVNSVSKSIDSGLYPLEYTKAGLKVLSSKFEKGGGTDSIQILNLGFTATEDFDPGFYLVNEGVPMLRNEYFSAEVCRSKHSEVLRTDSELLSAQPGTDALLLYGSGAQVETPITDSAGNLCGYSKQTIKLCNLSGVRRIDSDLVLSDIEYEGLVINNSLVSVGAKEIGIGGFSNAKLKLFINGTEPDIALRLINAMDNYRLRYGLTILWATENSTVDALSKLVTGLKSSSVTEWQIRVVDNFYTIVDEASGELKWVVKVAGVVTKLFSPTSYDKDTEILRIVMNKKSANSSVKMVTGSAEQSLGLQSELNKKLMQAQEQELSKLKTANVKFTVGLDPNKNALIKKQNKGGNNVSVVKGKRYALIGQGNMKLADAIVAGYTDFIHVENGSPVYFDLSSTTKLKSRLSAIEQLRQDLLSAYTGAYVVEDRHSLWEACAGQLIQIDAQLNHVSNAIINEVLRHIEHKDYTSFEVSVDIWDRGEEPE